MNFGSLNNVTYTITSNGADAIIENGEKIVAAKPGTVGIKVTGYYEGKLLSAEGTMTFEERTFNILAGEGPYFVGHDVTFTATEGTAQNFDLSKVVYIVESGEATVTGNVLKAGAEGTVKVYATCDCNGTTVRSNTVTLQFAYDGNVILKPEDLLKLKDSDATFNLLADIDLSSYESWMPITGFKGYLNGNGKKITGLNITVGNLEENKGLFDILAGTVENLTVEGTITSYGEAKNIGFICGTNNGTIKGVTVSGTIDTEYCDNVGGIVGGSSNSYITGCISNVNVTAKNYVGGIAGSVQANRAAATVNRDNVNNGEINGASYVGGIYGSLVVQDGKNNDTVTLTGHANNGSINGSGENIGGLFGNISGGS